MFSELIYKKFIFNFRLSCCFEIKLWLVYKTVNISSDVTLWTSSLVRCIFVSVIIRFQLTFIKSHVDQSMSSLVSPVFLILR